jgi:hypothetical protein
MRPPLDDRTLLYPLKSAKLELRGPNKTGVVTAKPEGADAGEAVLLGPLRADASGL